MKLFPRNMLKMKYNIGPVLHNRIILYFITILAVLDVVYLLGTNDVVSFSVLILVGILTSFFNKNMIVILVIAMVVTHILKYGTAGYVSEGMENQEGSATEEAASESKDSKESKEPKEPNDVKDKKDSVEYADLKKDYEEFQGIHDKIMGNMQQLDPLLNRAEAFINKFENYKANKEGFKKK